jgi:hypothetical protein
MTLMTQAEFARLKNVSRKSVTKWKAQGYLKMAGDRVHVEDTQASFARCASGRSYGKLAGLRTVHTAAAGVCTEVTGNTETPAEVEAIATTIQAGAYQLAVILRRRGMLQDEARRLTVDWVRATRLEMVGEHGGIEGALDVDGPKPPADYARWAEAPIFQGDPLVGEWDDVEQEAVE